MEDLKLGSYTATANEATGVVSVSDGTTVLNFMMAEGDGAKQAVTFASAMLDMKVLPPSVSFPPFKIEFHANGKTYLAKGETKVSFDRNNFDDLNKIIEMIVHKAADLLRLRGGAGGRGGNAFVVPESVI